MYNTFTLHPNTPVTTLQPYFYINIKQLEGKLPIKTNHVR